MKGYFKELPQLTRPEAATVGRMLVAGISEKHYRQGDNVIRIALRNHKDRYADVVVTYFSIAGEETVKTVGIRVAKGL